ncbi:MAG TPA: hypothetical protein VGH79_05355 [Gaiellaceae bacterium]|jgi:hypothetical protein
MRFPLPFVVGALTIVLVTGCAGGSRHGSTTTTSGKFPIVVTHPTVQTSGLTSPRARALHGSRIALLSPSQLGFMTSGSISCVWLPKRLTVLGPSAITIDMRVNGRADSCGSGAVVFPIAVKIDPRTIDVGRPLTVRLAYKVQTGGHTNQWNRTAVAPPFYVHGVPHQ